MKNKSFQTKCMGFALIALSILVSETFSIPSSRNFLRNRREAAAEAEPEPEPVTTASAVAMSSTVSPSSKGSDAEGSTSEPETSTGGKGSNIGKKVKDAVNSAEGWIKNAGESIKNSWDKAKEGIKNTASDVKDKVKKGIDSVRGKMNNSTNNATDSGSSEKSSDDCKDGKCGSDMEISSAENGSNEATAGSSDTTTNVPGNKKMKRRDVQGVNRYPSFSYNPYSSSIYGTGNIGGGSGYDESSSDSDSNEHVFSKKTTTGSLSEDNRRSKRSEQKQSDMNSSSNTSSSIPDSPSTESSNTRHKRSDQSQSDAMNSTQAEITTESTANRNGEGHRHKRDNTKSENTNTQMTEASTSSPSTGEKSDKNQSSSTKTKRSTNMDTSTKPPMESDTTASSANGKDNTNGEKRTKRDTVSTTGSTSDVDEKSKGSSSDSFSSTETAATSSSETDNDEESDYWDKHNSKNNSTFLVSVHLNSPSETITKNETISSNGSNIIYAINGIGFSSGNREENEENLHFAPPYFPESSIIPSYSHELGDIHPPIVSPPDANGEDTIPPSPVYHPTYSFKSSNENYNEDGNVRYGHYKRNGKMTRKGSSGHHRIHVDTTVGPSFQEFSSEEDSEYYPILESTVVEASTGSPVWRNLGGWAGSVSASSTSCKNHKGNDHFGSNHHHHKNSLECNDENHQHHHQYHTDENEDEEVDAGTLESGSINVDEDDSHYNQGDEKYYEHIGGGQNQNRNAEQSHINHHYQQENQHSHNKNYHEQNEQEDQHSHNRNHNNEQHEQENQHSHNKNHNNNGQHEQENPQNWGYGNGVISSGDASSEPSGMCRPLAGEAKCASLREDSTECLYDTDCSGTKKCCFYNCNPDKIVGICEYVTYTVKSGS